ncbi:unnamed protein product [Gongylonema pulchrum]|uniref:DDE-1 domain-containing protein n=1 Tax=Gongylonema pulchrum TaxID=637853 RepID=A0A183DM88_9BILA|nr:unnamed protein product [Gongylonema pulchrum]
MDVGEKAVYNLPLSLLENFINVKYQTQAKCGPEASMKLVQQYGEAAYVLVFMDWSGKSIPKPPAKFFTVKVIPYCAVANQLGKGGNGTEVDNIQHVKAEMPEYETDREKMAWIVAVS